MIQKDFSKLSLALNFKKMNNELDVSLILSIYIKVLGGINQEK